MAICKTKAVILYRILGFLISIGGIVLHLLADHVVETGFMVQHKLAYFTIQTNILSALLFAILLLQTIKQYREEGKCRIGMISPVLHGAIAFYITMTMVGFWGILAPTTGIPSNHFLLLNTLILHLITPLFTIVDFILFCPHGHLQKRHASLWLSYPVGYLCLVILYSRFIQEPYYSFQMGERTIELMYPYPFLDAGVMHVWGVIIAVVLIAASFYAVARLFVFMDKKLSERK